MHGYYNTYAFMHNFTPTNVGAFLVKMYNMNYFLHFATTDMVALSFLNKGK